MVVYCFGCENNSKNKPGMTFFRFPKDEIRCGLWFEVLGKPRLPNYNANYCYLNLKLCLAHFGSKDIHENQIKKRLDIDAVPISKSSSEELVILHSNLSTSGIIFWTHNETLTLIDCFKKFRNRVGTFEIKSMKRMWENKTKEINEDHNVNFNGNNCENRWRVIERNYKKYTDENNKTGRGRKTFEYSKEMDEVFGRKKNINPELLLSNETIQHEVNTEKGTPVNQKKKERKGESAMSEITTTNTDLSRTPLSRLKIKPSNRNNILEQMRYDKKKTFYSNLLKQHNKKLEFFKEKFNSNNELREQRLLELQRQNELLETRNTILEKYLKLKVSLPTGIF